MKNQKEKYKVDELLNEFENLQTSNISADWNEHLFQRIKSNSTTHYSKNVVSWAALSILIVMNLMALMLFMHPQKSTHENQRAEVMQKISTQFLINTEAH